MTEQNGLYTAIKTRGSVSRFFVCLALAVSMLLMVPLVAMQYTKEVNWSPFDFVFMWILLVGAGMMYKLVSRRMSNVPYRVAVGIAVVTSVILVWINGAVGIIGDGPVNLMYFGVLVVGLIGAVIANFQPRGMALALFGMAIAQALVPVIALIIWNSQISWEPGIVAVFGLNAVFVMFFVVSAVLFRSAAQMLPS